MAFAGVFAVCMAVLGAVLLVDNNSENLDASTTNVTTNVNGVIGVSAQVRRVDTFSGMYGNYNRNQRFTLNNFDFFVGIANNAGTISRFTGNITRIENSLRAPVPTPQGFSIQEQMDVHYHLQIPAGHQLFVTTTNVSVGGSIPTTGLNRVADAGLSSAPGTGTGFLRIQGHNRNPAGFHISHVQGRFDIHTANATGGITSLFSYTSPIQNQPFSNLNTSNVGRRHFLLLPSRTITWDTNNGIWTGTNPVGVSGSGVTGNRTTIVAQGITPIQPQTASFTLTRTNYTFGGWTPALTAVGGTNRTHTAIWTTIMRGITWNPNGGIWADTQNSNNRNTSVQQGSTPTQPAVLNNRPGFTFAHWDPALTPVGTTDRTHTARWNRTITRHYHDMWGPPVTSTQHLLVGSQHTIAATGGGANSLNSNGWGEGANEIRFAGWNIVSREQANQGIVTPGWAVGNTVTISYDTPANIWWVFEWGEPRIIDRQLANPLFPQTTSLAPMSQITNIRHPGQVALGTPSTAQIPHGFRFIGWASTPANRDAGIADLGTNWNIPLDTTTSRTALAVWERDTNVLPNFPDPLPPHIEQGWWIIRLNFTGGISTESFVETRFYDPNPGMAGTASRTLPAVSYMNTWASMAGNDFEGRTFLGWFTTPTTGGEQITVIPVGSNGVWSLYARWG